MSRLQRLFLAAMLLSPLPVLAGPYADDMAKCLVRSTTAEDKSVLVQWMFATAALHPAVKSLSAVTVSQRTDLNRRFATMAETLLTKSCLAETRDAVKYEGWSTVESSFSILGQVAGRELFANSDVASGMKELEQYFDAQKVRNTIGSDQK